MSISPQTLTVGILCLIGGIGALGLISPRLFTALCQRSGHWVNTERLLAPLDKPIDIDHYVLPYSRVLGASVLAAVCLLARILLG